MNELVRHKESAWIVKQEPLSVEEIRGTRSYVVREASRLRHEGRAIAIDGGMYFDSVRAEYVCRVRYTHPRVDVRRSVKRFFIGFIGALFLALLVGGLYFAYKGSVYALAFVIGFLCLPFIVNRFK